MASKFKPGDTGRRIMDRGLRFDGTQDKKGYTFVVSHVAVSTVTDTGGFSHGIEAVERVSEKDVVELAIAECEANLSKLKAQLADLFFPKVGDKVRKLDFTEPNGCYYVLRAIVTWRGMAQRGKTQYVVQFVAKDQDPNDTSDLDICTIVDAVNWKKLDDQ